MRPFEKACCLYDSIWASVVSSGIIRPPRLFNKRRVCRHPPELSAYDFIKMLFATCDWSDVGVCARYKHCHHLVSWYNTWMTIVKALKDYTIQQPVNDSRPKFKFSLTLPSALGFSQASWGEYYRCPVLRFGSTLSNAKVRANKEFPVINDMHDDDQVLCQVHEHIEVCWVWNRTECSWRSITLNNLNGLNGWRFILARSPVHLEWRLYFERVDEPHVSSVHQEL